MCQYEVEAWPPSTVAVVTGSNKGIGFETARELARAGLTVVMTARSDKLGAQAVDAIASSQGVSGKVMFHQLDISNQASVDAFAAWLKQEFSSGVDILINNAGIVYKGEEFGVEETQETLATNFYGTVSVTKALLPFIKDKTGRIVNVSSRAGILDIIPNEALKAKIAAANIEQLEDFSAKFLKDLKAGNLLQEGWPDRLTHFGETNPPLSYGISKLLVSMYTRALANVVQSRGIMVNCTCPGWCLTDMTNWRGLEEGKGPPSSALDGAETTVWLALRSTSQSVSGKYFAEKAEISF